MDGVTPARWMLAGALARTHLNRTRYSIEMLAELGGFSQRIEEDDVGQRRIDVLRRWIDEMDAYIEENK